MIEGDVFALGRVYRNLLLNAIQATAPGGEVTVAVDGDTHRARVRIGDTGCGIPQERLAEIFEDFATTKRRGLGLGLPISKKIVEQLGGAITVDSGAGRGTTVGLEFPRVAPPPAAPGPASSSLMVYRNKSGWSPRTNQPDEHVADVLTCAGARRPSSA